MPHPPSRLKHRASFLSAASKGRRFATGGFIMQALARDDTDPIRVGYTVTRKVGNAVVRNRTRRRLREAARLVLGESDAHGVDLVLIGRQATQRLPFAELLADLRQALDRMGVA